MAPSHDPHTPVPPRAGVGLKAEHYREIVETGPDIGFFEVHAENYMGAGGPPHRYLTTIRDRYPLSLHGVGLSIGANRPLDRAHLQRLKELRSEEHTSELQSLMRISYAVFCLKKKTTTTTRTTTQAPPT